MGRPRDPCFLFDSYPAVRLAHGLLPPDCRALDLERNDVRRIAMANTILGIFDDPIAAHRAVEILRDGPLQLDDISIVARATTTTEASGSSADDVSAGEGAAVGAVWGGLVGLATLLIPGVGPFIAFGALGAALTGAATGAMVGGIAAALIDFSGIPADDARSYQQQIHAGKTLVAVKARDEDAIEVRRAMASAGADSIRDNQTDMTHAAGTPVRIAMYDGSGRRVSEEREYGAPVDSTAVRHGIYDQSAVDRGTKLPYSTPGGLSAINSPLGTGRADQVEPHESDSSTVDASYTDVATPESLGNTKDTERGQS
jgi:uncharacterized membrane protein